MEVRGLIDISVIVPVYNTEQYLRQCIDSLVNQTLVNVEFIFVDDGSTDHSVEIIEKYQKQDNRIYLIKQNNQYAGVARNNGMKRATGKYIIFLDSDDFFELNMLEEAFNCAEKNQAEITIFSYSTYDQKTKESKDYPYYRFPEGCFSLEQIGPSFFSSYTDGPCNKLFLKSFVTENKVFFQPVRKCNDTLFTHILACLAKRIVYLPKRLYYYRVNNSSSLQGNKDLDRSAIIKTEIAIKQEMISRRIYYGVMKDAYIAHLCMILKYYGTEDGSIESLSEFYNALKESFFSDLFDSEKDFEHDDWLRLTCQSDSFASFLLSQMQYYKQKYSLAIKQRDSETVSKKSKDYLIGHAVMALPRAVRDVFRKKK